VLGRDDTVLVAVDAQEAFRPAVRDFDDVVHNIGVLVQGARTLGVPVVVTEQYPRGLGHTVPEVAEHLDGVHPLEKTAFSAARANGFNSGEREKALVCGIETHVCVLQTVEDLLERGMEVHVVADAVTSRTEANREVGLRRMEKDGATITSVETALFELLGAAGGHEFKTVQGLIK
jgi:nicotinamidase-related amidase